MGFLDNVVSMATKIAENMGSGDTPKHSAESIREDAAKVGAEAKALGSLASERLTKSLAETLAAAAPLAKAALAAATEIAERAAIEFSELHGKVESFSAAKEAVPSEPVPDIAAKVRARSGATPKAAKPARKAAAKPAGLAGKVAAKRAAADSAKSAAAPPAQPKAKKPGAK